MNTIVTELDLKNEILRLENCSREQAIVLREQFHQTYESLKPINIIKNTFKKVSESEEVKETIVNSSVGLTTGFLIKKIFEGFTRGPFTHIAGTALMFGVSSFVKNNPDTVRSFGKGMLNLLHSKKEKQDEETG